MGIADWTQMAADLALVRADNEISIVIRRGGSTLAAQGVRVARLAGAPSTRDSAGGQQVTGRVVVLGSTSFDVEVGDRFNDGADVLYEVTFVRPNRRAGVIAEARQVE